MYHTFSKNIDLMVSLFNFFIDLFKLFIYLFIFEFIFIDLIVYFMWGGGGHQRRRRLVGGAGSLHPRLWSQAGHRRHDAGEGL